MDNSAVAHIRTPNDDELRHVRELWAALKQKSLPASTDIGIELQTYFAMLSEWSGSLLICTQLQANPRLPGNFHCKCRKMVLRAFTMQSACGLQASPCGPRTEETPTHLTMGSCRKISMTPTTREPRLRPRRSIGRS